MWKIKIELGKQTMAFLERLQGLLTIIERKIDQMAIDYNKINTSIEGLKTSIATGFQNVEKEVGETADEVRKLRDQIAAGQLNETEIQAKLDEFATGLDTIATDAGSKSTSIASNLDSLQTQVTP